MPYALQVHRDPEDQQFHWVVLEEHPDDSGHFTPFSAGETGCATYAHAWAEGSQALAAADGESLGGMLVRGLVVGESMAPVRPRAQGTDIQNG